jgi:hypothetical protein
MKRIELIRKNLPTTLATSIHLRIENLRYLQSSDFEALVPHSCRHAVQPAQAMALPSASFSQPFLTYTLDFACYGVGVTCLGGRARLKLRAVYIDEKQLHEEALAEDKNQYVRRSIESVSISSSTS